MLILDLNPFTSKVKGKHSIDTEFQKSSCARKETADIDIFVTSRNGNRNIMQSIRIINRQGFHRCCIM